MKIHDEIDDWIAGALCDALSPDEQQHFEQHLAECPHCRSLYEETRKMNDILNQSVPELRPDPNFEHRVIAAFRERIASGGFHPWRGLVWFVQFRTVQAALALLALAALIGGGEMLTGDSWAPKSPVLAAVARIIKLPQASTPTIIGSNAYVDNSTNQVISQLHQSEAFEPFVVDSIPAVPTSAFNALSDVADASFWKPYGEDSKVTVGNGILTGSNAIVTTKSGQRSPVTSNISGDTGIQFATTYYSRGIIQGPQGSSFQPTQYLRSSGLSLGSNAMTVTGSNAYSGATTITNGGLFNSGVATVTFTGSASNQGQVVPVQVGTGATTVPQEVSAERLQKLKYFSRVSQTQLQRPVFDTRKVTTGVSVYAKNSETVASDPNSAVPASPASASTPAPVDTSKLIRNATLDFEVQSYEKSLDTITAVAGEEQGYVATQNSESGPNGKLQGEIVVKVLPPNLDRFLMKLRALGDMKNQTISTQDVTKDYYDTEARIRNSQITEQRLNEILKKNTGDMGDLLTVEKEIGRVRGEIEEMQGQLKMYDSQVAYATVTITLHEKDVNSTAAFLLQEHAQLSIFTKDVEKAFADAKAAAETAKAQTLDSHIERNPDGRTSATLHLLIPPDASDDAISKLKTLGRIQNFNSQTQRIARDGSGNSDNAKVEHDKVELDLVIQRDEENAVQGTNISVQTDQVEEKTAAIKQAAATAGIEVKGAEFNRAQNGVEVSDMLLRMPVRKYAAFLEQIKSLGKVKDFTVTRREDATATDDAPAEISLQIYSQPPIVTEDHGVWATTRGTLGDGFSALMWSLRMIGVSLAFIAPWAVALGLTLWLVLRRRRLAKK